MKKITTKKIIWKYSNLPIFRSSRFWYIYVSMILNQNFRDKGVVVYKEHFRSRLENSKQRELPLKNNQKGYRNCKKATFNEQKGLDSETDMAICRRPFNNIQKWVAPPSQDRKRERVPISIKQRIEHGRVGWVRNIRQHLKMTNVISPKRREKLTFKEPTKQYAEIYSRNTLYLYPRKSTKKHTNVSI